MINTDVGSRTTGVRSFTMCHDTAYSTVARTWLAQLPTIKVYPAGFAALARVEPMVEPAPVTFSTIIGCPSEWRICSAIMRASASVGPPAGNGTMIVMGRDGYVSASAA